MALICQLISQALSANWRVQGRRAHLLSVDEKTSIQALERIAQQHMKPGQVQRRDPEYKRNGTTTLMAIYDVVKGRIVHYQLQPTRNEEDFAALIKGLVLSLPQEDAIIFLADQLNTHMSASLVELVAQQIGFSGDLGKKEAHGILHNMESRKAFLEDDQHRIRFVYTPKHCSWLNPVENWFAKLQRQVISRGSFPSVKELQHNIEAFISFYNSCMAKPLNWKFKGFDLVEKTNSIVPSN